MTAPRKPSAAQRWSDRPATMRRRVIDLLAADAEAQEECARHPGDEGPAMHTSWARTLRAAIAELDALCPTPAGREAARRAR